MTESIITFYDKNLTFNSLVIKKQHFILRILPHIFICTICCIYLIYLFKLINEITFVLIALFFTIIFSGAIRYFLAKTIKKNYPNCKTTRFNWSSEELNNFKYVELKKYFIEYRLENKINNIKTLIEKKIEKEKYTMIVQSTFFASILYILTSNFIEKIFNLFENNITYLSVVYSLLFLCLLAVTLQIPTFIEIRDSIFKYKKLNDLSELLDEYSIIEDYIELNP